MTKPTTRLVQPAKTWISLPIRTVWSESFAEGMCLIQTSGNPKRDEQELLLYWVDVQADLSLCWSHRSYCVLCWLISLRKHAYSNILKILLPKNENFQLKISDIFHISAQNIDCGYSLEPPRRGGSNEYPQSLFEAEIRKIMYTPVNPSFTI